STRSTSFTPCCRSVTADQSTPEAAFARPAVHSWDEARASGVLGGQVDGLTATKLWDTTRGNVLFLPRRGAPTTSRQAPWGRRAGGGGMPSVERIGMIQ